VTEAATSWPRLSRLPARPYPDLDLTAALSSGAPASVFLAESEHAQVVVLGARSEGRIGDLLLDRSACRSSGMRRAQWSWSTTSPAATAASSSKPDGSPNSAAFAYAFRFTR
jgi:hypothetical protein